MFKLFIFSFGILNLLLALYATFRISLQKRKLSFIWWWAFVNGSFVWEDMMVFGLLHFALAMIALYYNNSQLWLIGFLIFWVVRSAGETLYFFLQQFIEPSKHPHDIHEHFAVLRRIFGNISDQKCFIIIQVMMQSILVLSTVFLVIILLQLY